VIALCRGLLRGPSISDIAHGYRSDDTLIIIKNLQNFVTVIRRML